MNTTTIESAELLFQSSLRTLTKQGVDTEKIARLLISQLGIYNASDVAYQINEVEKTIPTNETERE